MPFVASLKGGASSFKSNLDTMLARLYPTLPDPAVDLSGKRALVTGSTAGIGKEMAKVLAAKGASVVILCRSEAKGRATVAELRAATGHPHIEFEVLELGSLDSVRAFVDRWGKRSQEGRKIDILINNAGIASTKRTTSPDGLEQTYQVNVAAPFLLTTLLLQQGSFAVNARIVQVTSIAMYISGRVNPNDLNATTELGGLAEEEGYGFELATKIYAKTKAQQVILSRELQDKLSGSTKYNHVVVSSCHPGNIFTGMWSDPAGMGRVKEENKSVISFIEKISISVEEGAKTGVYVAIAPELSKPGMGGKYWSRCAWRWTPAWMEDETLRKELWKQWEKDVGVEASQF